MEIQTTVCQKCGHEWIIRISEPKTCPRCKSYLQPRKISSKRRTRK